MQPIASYGVMLIVVAGMSRYVSTSFKTDSPITYAIRGLVVVLSLFLVIYPQKLLFGGVHARDIFFQRPLTDLSRYEVPKA